MTPEAEDRFWITAIWCVWVHVVMWTAAIVAYGAAS